MKKTIIVLCIGLLLAGCTVENEDNLEEAEPEEMEVVVEAVDEDMDQVVETTEEVMVAEYRKITPEEAKDMMVEGNIILDVRTQGEYDDGHIQDATLLPVDDILDGKLDLLPDKNQVILVYCRSGNRSGTASRALVEEGYTRVYDFGGITDWPYDIVN